MPPETSGSVGQDRIPTTAAPDPRAIGAHDCPRCGEPYSLDDGCGCPTTTAAGSWLPRQTLRALLREAVDLRMTLYYGIDYGKQPELSDAANRLGGVLAKMEQVLNATD